METLPYVPVVPFPEMASQLPPIVPSWLHVKSISSPMMALVFVVCGVKRHARDCSRQLQLLSLGVGGSVETAKKVEFVVGQEGYVVDPGALGVLGGDTWPYCAWSRLKSSLTVTVLPSIVTMPNWPWLLCAGK